MKLRHIAILTITGVVLFSVFFAIQLPKITFDYDFIKFFPQNDPETDFFLNHQKRFTTDNDFILIGIENDKTIFDPSFLKEVNRLELALVQLPYVTEVISPTNLKEKIQDKFLGQIFEKPYLHFEDPTKYEQDSIRIFQTNELVNSYFSEDGKAISITLRHKEYLSKVKCDELVIALKKLLSEFHFKELHASGRSLGENYFVQRMQKELMIFVSASAVLIIIFLFFAFRSVWGIWVPMAVVLLSLIWLLGIIHLAHKSIDLIMTIMPTIMFVVGMSDVVHIITKYLDELRLGKEKLQSLKIAFKEIALATFLTTFTTAIGFLTLTTSNIGPLKEFGVYTAIGVFVAYILAYTLLPAVLILSPKPRLSIKTQQNVFWNRMLHRSFSFLLRNTRITFFAFFTLLLITGCGLFKLEINNFLLEDLKPDNEFRKDFNYFEERFAGIRPFEMAISVKDESKNILSKEVINEIEKIEKYLNEEYGIGFLVSPLNVIRTVNKAVNLGRLESYSIPEQDFEYEKITKQISRFSNSRELKLLITEDLKHARITGKCGDWGNKVISEKNENLALFFADTIDTTLINYHVTGTAHLIDRNNDTITVNLIKGLSIAFGAVAFIIMFLYRSWRMALIALVPNVIPLVIIAGLMGWLGIDLKVSTSIVFTIAFGIAVDDSIHFLSRFKLELSKGKPLLYSLKRTYISTGKAIIITTLILCSGFFTLLASTFMGTFYTGLLISLTLFFALICDLLLLPVLIIWFPPKTKLSGNNKMSS